MRESGEPMEFGILDNFKVFSRAFGEGGDGAVGLRMEAGGFRQQPHTPLRLIHGTISVYMLG